MPMTVRMRFRLTVAVWILGGIAVLLGTAPATAEPVMIMGALALGLYTLALRCPNCRKPVLHNPVTLFGSKVWIWTSWVPTRCTQCGELLP